MKVILFKLDAPGNKHEWLFQDTEIKTLEDIEQVMGYCSNHIYVKLYQIDEDDDPSLVKEVNRILSIWYPRTAKDTIMRLFKLIEKATSLEWAKR
jgi:hypothetical protein